MPYGTGLRRAPCPTRTWSGMPQRVSVWGRWFIWLAGVFLLAYRPGFWYPQDIEFLAIPVLLGVVNALVHHPAPDKQDGDLALDAPPLRHGHCIGHFWRRHRRRVQELHIPGPLSDPRRFCRGLLVLLAQPGLDHGGRPGCGIAGAWRTRSGLPGGAWWTGFSQKHPSGDRA